MLSLHQWYRKARGLDIKEGGQKTESIIPSMYPVHSRVPIVFNNNSPREVANPISDGRVPDKRLPSTHNDASGYRIAKQTVS